MKIHFLIHGDLNSLTGGNIYDRQVIEGLRLKGHDVHLISIPGQMSNFGSAGNFCHNQLKMLAQGSIVVIDSLVLGYLNKTIREFNRKLYILGLIHLPVSMDIKTGNAESRLSDTELDAMNSVTHLVVTGKFMLQFLETAGVSPDRITLIEPGVDTFPRKKQYNKVPSELLCISNYSVTKAQLILFRALNLLRERNWMLRLYGDISTGKDYVGILKAFLNDQNLESRILIHDKLSRHEISTPYSKADLFILPSLFESYGMVLAESLAHGIPVVTTSAGNIPFTVPASMGLFTEPGNAENLAGALDALFSDPRKYRRLCKAASGYHRTAVTWRSAVDRFEIMLKRITLF